MSPRAGETASLFRRRTTRALSRGEIDVRRARVLLDATVDLNVKTADTVVARGLAEAGHLTTGQLRARLVEHRLTADPGEAKARYQASIENRRVVVSANLHALNLPPDQVMAARRRINRLARQAKTPENNRTADQRRADTLLDLLRKSCPAETPGATSVQPTRSTNIHAEATHD